MSWKNDYIVTLDMLLTKILMEFMFKTGVGKLHPGSLSGVDQRVIYFSFG
jgi:hypothetical protein